MKFYVKMSLHGLSIRVLKSIVKINRKRFEHDGRKSDKVIILILTDKIVTKKDDYLR